MSEYYTGYRRPDELDPRVQRRKSWAPWFKQHVNRRLRTRRWLFRLIEQDRQHWERQMDRLVFNAVLAAMVKPR